jgi:hypothetical protein
MPTAQARNIHVIARYLESLPNDQGWWYRVPKLNDKPRKTTDFDPDDGMPHLGTLFGLTEDATSIILVLEMGCLSERQKETTTITCLQDGHNHEKEKKAGRITQAARVLKRGVGPAFIQLAIVESKRLNN